MNISFKIFFSTFGYRSDTNFIGMVYQNCKFDVIHRQWFYIRVSILKSMGGGGGVEKSTGSRGLNCVVYQYTAY